MDSDRKQKHRHHHKDRRNSRSSSRDHRHKQKEQRRSRSIDQKKIQFVKDDTKVENSTTSQIKMEVEQQNGNNKPVQNRRFKIVFIKDLPKKPPRNTTYQQGSREIKLVTNNYDVKYDQNGQIVVYSVVFYPFVFQQNQNLKREIIKSQDAILRQYLGNFIFYNSLIIGAKESPEFSFKLQKPVVFENIEYTIEIRKLKVVKMSDLRSPDPLIQQKPLMFFNYIIKDFFKTLRYFEHGKQKKFHDISSRHQIPETELSIIPGFAVNFQNNESGFAFKIDISHRIIRTVTALEFINKHYRELLDKKKGKEDIRRFVTYLMTKQLVLANYGTYRTYQVDDLLFDQNTSEFTVDVSDSLGKSTSITVDDYFRQRYQYEIKNKKAPLILYNDTRINKKLYLVAELCIMAGIPDDLTEFTRKQIQKECQQTPKDRFFKIKKMQNDLFTKQPNEGLTADKLKQQFGIEIKQQPITVVGKQLKPPEILFGDKNVIPQGDRENFSFNTQNHTAFCKIYDIKYAVIYPPEFDYEQFKKQLETNTQNYAVKMSGSIQAFKISDRRQQQVQEIEQNIKSLDPSVNMVVIILNRFLKPFYAQIKKLCLSDRCGIVSQVIQMDTINKKGYGQIVSKIIMQILDKIGNPIWSVQVPQKWPENTMLICAIVEKNNCGILSSVDKYYSRYYSQLSSKIIDKAIIQDLALYIQNAFKAYYDFNKVYPERIIYFRDGLSDDQIINVLKVEIPDLLLAAKAISPTFQNKLIVINIQMSVVTKIFREDKDYIYNAPAGTVVDHTIVSSNYEFLLIPVYSARGCPKPILYRVIYDKIDIPMEQLQDFVYGQCYNYQNWAGSIKMPAIVKNCQRMIKFINEVTQIEPTKKLKQSFYYL